MNPALTSSWVPLNKINKIHNAVFDSEEDARKYEEGVLAQIRVQMENLRVRKDEFSSSNEVDL
jgi:hypothetical protein